jgi:hypothetical protein
MVTFLNKQSDKVKEALEFKKDEKKAIVALLAEIFKSKKFEMTPEQSLLGLLALHYGTAGYQLVMANIETRKWLKIINDTIIEQKNMNNTPSRTTARPPKENKKTKPEPDVVADIDETNESNETKASAEGTIAETREPGEKALIDKPKNGKRKKRVAHLQNIEDVVPVG